MPTMTICTVNKEIVTIAIAIDMKQSSERNKTISPDFRCTECQQPVRPHQAGGSKSAHFEHLERNPDCSQSHVAR